jgi:predicted dehydrogenase
MSVVRLGVIGAGWFASRRHCPDVVEHPKAQLTAFCRRDAGQLRQMAEKFEVKHSFTDYRDLLESGTVDGVIICSPHHLHYEHTRAALEKGLHVLLEKPITIDPAQGYELVRLAVAQERSLIVAQNPPYWSHCRFLRQQLQDGPLGELEAAHIHWVGNAKGVLGLEELPANMPGVVAPTLFRQNREENGGGFLVDGGSHLICELIWCSGLRVRQVTAQMDNAEWDVRAVLTLELENGAFATISNLGDSAIRDKRQHSLYYGSTGTATVRGFPGRIMLETDGQTRNIHEQELPAPPSPVGNLVDCMLGQGEPEISGETAVHVVEVLSAAYESAQSGKRVTI